MISGCKICNSRNLYEIEEMIDNGVPYSVICERFPDINPMNISRHKAHMIGDNPEKLQELINKALHSNLAVENISDLVRLLDHQKRFQESNYGDCNNCKFKLDATTNSFQKFLSEDNEGVKINAVTSFIDGKTRTLEEHLGGSAVMSDEEYKEDRKKYKIDGV